MSNFKVTGPLLRILALGSLWAGYSKNYILSCSNLVRILNMERGRSLLRILDMERGRSLLIFKVKGHISRSMGLYKEFWHLDPCGQDIAKTIWPRMLKLSVYTLYGQSKKPIHFQGQMSNFKVTEPLQRILALGSLWAGYSKNYTA